MGSGKPPGAPDPTSFINSHTIRVRSWRLNTPIVLSGSEIVQPALRLGLKDVAASWNIIWRGGLSLCNSLSLQHVTSSPSNQIFSQIGFCFWTIARATLHFPHPDSPTSPSVSPLSMLKTFSIRTLCDIGSGQRCQSMSIGSTTR